MTYLDAIAAEIKQAVSSELLPDDDMYDLFLIYAVLLLAKGKAVTREDVHNAWVAWMESSGKIHKSMVPFTSLPQQMGPTSTIGCKSNAKGIVEHVA